MLKLKTVCKLIVGTPVNVFAQGVSDYLAWGCSPEVVAQQLGDCTVVEMYTVIPERRGDSPSITIVVA